MELFTPDYFVLAALIGGAVVGLFVGFSGALAFLAGTLLAGGAAAFVWPISAEYLTATWARALAIGIGAIVIFGLIRLFVKRLIHGLIAQPGDAIFGSLISALAAAACALGIIWSIGVVSGEQPKSALFDKVISVCPHSASSSQLY